MSLDKFIKKKNRIETFRAQYKYCRHIVTRLFKLEDLELFLNGSNYDYVATVENEPNYHVHILLFSNKEIPREKIRQEIKNYNENIPDSDRDYKNGKLNIHPQYQEDFYTSLCYVVKSYESIYYREIYSIDYHMICLAKADSYEKYPDVKKLLKKLHKQLRKGEITPVQATQEYFWIKNNTESISTNVYQKYQDFKFVSKTMNRLQSDKFIQEVVEQFASPFDNFERAFENVK